MLMVSGLEEAYFTVLSRLVLARQAAAGELTLGWHADIGALYFRVLQGLDGYPKMSKSIPASSIHLGMSTDELSERILSDDETSQPILLSAVELSSGWPDNMLADARAAYANRATDTKAWLAVKADYLTTFQTFSQRWESCSP